MPGSARRSGRAARSSPRSPSRACRPGSRRSPRREERRERRRASPRRGCGSSSPAASHASAQRIPSPPAFVSTATRRPRGSGLAREQRRDVEQLLERVGADHAGLVEERVDGGLRAGERGGVRAGRPRARRACGRSSSRGSASSRATPPCDAARTCAGCRTTRGRGARGRSRRRPPTTRAGRSRRRRPCCRSRRRPRSRARAPRPRSSSARPSAPLCDEKPMRPGREGPRREGRVEARPRPTAMPRQFGPDEPRAVRADEREQLLLALAPSRPDLGEAGGDHAERADALLRAPPRPRRARARRGGRSTARSIVVRDLVDRAVGAHAGDGLAGAVDRVGGAR